MFFSVQHQYLTKTPTCCQRLNAGLTGELLGKLLFLGQVGVHGTLPFYAGEGG